MKVNQLHSWNVQPDEAVAIQKGLRVWIIEDDQFGKINTFARIQLSLYHNTFITTQVSLISAHNGEVLEQHTNHEESEFPHLPNLISFRKAPSIISALEKIQQQPDLIICDGLGVAHPHNFGVASHIGLLTNTPTIAIKVCDKDNPAPELLNERGAWVSNQTEESEPASGAYMRLHANYPPLFVSTGHRISLKSCIHTLLQLTPQNADDNDLINLIYPHDALLSGTEV